MSKFTLTFSDRGEESEQSGWTSFWGYYPELMLSLAGKFYSFKDGQIYEHNDNDNITRNIFYNQSVVSKITTILNAQNAEDKIFKTLVIEGNDSWHTEIKTNYTNSEIKQEEYAKKESKFYAHIRKNEDEDDYTDRAQGIGIIEDIDNNEITFSEPIPTLVNAGEQLFQLNNGGQELIGDITDIQGDTIVIDTIINQPIVNAFCFSVKSARIQGSEIRGYFAEVTLTNDSNERVELFAINSNVVLSHTTTTQ